MAPSNQITDHGLRQFIKMHQANGDGELFSGAAQIPLRARNKSIAAVAIGCIVLLASGGFGVFGFMYPSAIGTIGQTTHLWGLWSIVGAGGVFGSIVLSIGSVKIHQNRGRITLIKRQETLYKSFLEMKDIKDNLEFIKNTTDPTKALKKLHAASYKHLKRLDYGQYYINKRPSCDFYQVILRTSLDTYLISSRLSSHFQARILVALCQLKEEEAAVASTSSR